MVSMIFTQIPDSLPYPKKFKSKLMQLHSFVIDYVLQHYDSNCKYVDKRKIVDLLNDITYGCIEGLAWVDEIFYSDNLFDVAEHIDEFECKSIISNMYINLKDVLWDLSDSVTDSQISKTFKQPKSIFTATATSAETCTTAVSDGLTPTPKSDLYIRPPLIPQFDVNNKIISHSEFNNSYVIYSSLPRVPTRQVEISVSTNVDDFSDSELLKLFPNHLIHTRPVSMYSSVEGLELHPKLGLILPIDGFSTSDCIDNLIRYPHLYKLTKIVDGTLQNFASTIELDGKLHKVSEIWSSLPESSTIPYVVDFVKEYVIRRYLLERDILGMKHNYPMFGTLEPFLTLFTTPEDYQTFKYFDPIELARACVKSRVSYKRSRNPILRMVESNA